MPRGECACKDGCPVICGDVLDIAPQLSSLSMVFGSPPYSDARTYGIGADRTCEEWVDWMLEVSLACQQCTLGPIIWVVAGVTRKRNYWPGPEGLMWKWWKRGDDCQLYRPCAFHRVGIPGSGGTDWFRSDWEYIVCLKRPGALPWADNTACGQPPRWAPGGEMSYRLTDGQRRNQWGHSGTGYAGARRKDGKRDKTFRPSHKQHTKRRADGAREVQDYRPPVKANPGNLLTGVGYLQDCQATLDQYERGTVRSGKVGGGLMGDKLAHENEAAFPEWLAEVFVASFCPPGGAVLDPFVGSGTTLAVARKLGRRGIGIDIRESQCELTSRRLKQGLLFT